MLTRQMAISRRGSFIHVFQSPPQEGWPKAGVGSKRLILSHEFKKSPTDSAEDPNFQKKSAGYDFQKQSAEMISSCRVEFRVAASQFIVFGFITCWVWF